MTGRRTITIRNVDEDVLALLAQIRATERRQMAVIFEEALRVYWEQYYDDPEGGDDL